MTSTIARKRERKGKILQPTIDTSSTILDPHMPHHEEENITENNSRCRQGIFERQKSPHAPSKTRVSAETDGMFSDAPKVSCHNIY